MSKPGSLFKLGRLSEVVTPLGSFNEESERQALWVLRGNVFVGRVRVCVFHFLWVLKKQKCLLATVHLSITQGLFYFPSFLLLLLFFLTQHPSRLVEHFPSSYSSCFGETEGEGKAKTCTHACTHTTHS